MNPPTSSSSSSSAPTQIPRGKRLLQAKLGPDVAIVAWGKAWVSRDGRLPRVLAARTSDFVAVTPDRVVLYSTGFFTRKPRRRVYDRPRAGLAVDEVPRRRGRSLRVATNGNGHPLLFDLSGKRRNRLLASQLLQPAKQDDAE